MGRDPRRLFYSCALVAFAGCQSAPADVREWRATDHDHTDNPNAAQVDTRDGGGRPAAGMMGLDEVTLAAWKSNCTVCHGLIGRGDGPKGPGTKARDLTDPAWQSAVTDEQMAAIIKAGKGEMPPFDLPDSTIKGLIKLVRLLNPARLAAPADGDAGLDGGKPRDGGRVDAGKPRDGGAPMREGGLVVKDGGSTPSAP